MASFFIQPFALTLLLIIPIAGLFIAWRNWQRRKTLHRIGDEPLIHDLTSQLSNARRRNKAVLWSLCVACIIIALARPVWGIDEEFVEVQGISITIVLDVSASMNAQDVLPTRLERAKLAARNLFEQEADIQLALVLFAGSAFVQFPLTTDHTAALTFLNAASTETISRQGSALEQALRLALETVDDRIVSHSLIVLLTDGEYHEGNALLTASEAAQRGVSIHVIGYGDEEGAPVPEFDADGNISGYKTDQAGNIVISKLNEPVLREIASMTGGTYERATASGIEIVNLLNTINDIERGFLETRSQIRRTEQFPVFILLAVLSLMLEIYISETRR